MKTTKGSSNKLAVFNAGSSQETQCFQRRQLQNDRDVPADRPKKPNVFNEGNCQNRRATADWPRNPNVFNVPANLAARTMSSMYKARITPQLGDMT